jgi:hypothetical protein
MTALADITSIVPAFKIDRMIQEANRSPPVMLQNGLVDGEVEGTGTGNVIRFARSTGTTVPAGNKAEGAAFTTVTSSLAHSTLSGGWVGYRDYITWEANMHGVERALSVVVMNAMQALPERVDIDLLALVGTAATSTSRTGTTLRDEDMITGRAAFAAKHPHRTGGGWCSVLNIAQARDWALDLKNNGGQQLGGNDQSNNAAAVQQIAEGFLSSRHGMRHFVTDNVDTAAGDALGGLFCAGDGGPLLYRVWQTIAWESEPILDEKRWLFVVSAYYGVAVRNQNDLHGLVSRAA